MMLRKPLKEVIRHEYEGACRYTGYNNNRIRLFLSCGHETTRKQSQGVPQKAACYECSKI